MRSQNRNLAKVFMLGKTWKPERATFPCIASPKLNGVRAMYHPPDSKFLRRGQGPGFYSRTGVKYEVLDHIKPVDRYVQDGELYVHGWPLQRIMAAVAPNRQEATPDSEIVRFHVFDTVTEGDALRRKMLLKFCESGGVTPVMYRVLHRQAELDEYHYLCTQNGYEGAMVLNAYSAYTSGRTDNLLKMKDYQFMMARCTGFKLGTGKCEGLMGSLKCATETLDYKDIKFNVGTGFADEERNIDFVAKHYIGKIIVVRFLLLSDDSIPIQPSFVRVADMLDMNTNYVPEVDPIDHLHFIRQ